MGKYISKKELLDMLKDVPESAMLSVVDIHAKNVDYPIIEVKDTTMAGFYEIRIDSRKAW